MTSLIGYNGGLLSVGGSLTTDPNCCCDGPPPPECPPCCIRIDWGSFNVDGDLYEQYTEDGITIDVRVIMPTKNSRIVCDGEEISVQWDVDDDPSNRGSWIRFGVAWEFGGETPSVGAGGEIYEFGLVDWLDVSASDYTVALTLNKCFLDTVTYNGFIQIGTDFPDWRIDIETARCPTTSRCCDIEPECANCCALIDLEDYATFEGKHYIVNNSTDAEGNIFTALLEISLPAPGIICKSESVILDLYLIPPRHGDIDNNTVITFPVPWTLDTFTPAINPVDGAELANEIDWGTLTATEYSATVNIDCEDSPCPPPLDFPMITVTNSQYGFAANVDFEECDVEGCCEPVCCCDKITGYDVEITGIVDIPGVDCDCSNLNINVFVPKTASDGVECSGSLTLEDGVACPGDTGTQTIGWTLRCNEDGTHTLQVIATGVDQGSSDLITFDRLFDECTPCLELEGEQACADCIPAPFPPQGNFCDYTNAIIKVTPRIT